MRQLPERHQQQFFPDQYLWFRSRNLDEARHTISSAYDSHQLEALGTQREVDISLHVASLNSVNFSLVEYGSDVVATIGEGTGIYVLMPISGELEVKSGTHKIHCEPGCAVIQNAGTGFQKVMRNGYRQLVVKFDPQVLLHHVGKLNGVAPNTPIHFDSMMDISSSMGASWWRTVNYVMEELRSADPASPQQLIYEPLEQLLIRNILRCQRHNYTDLLAAPKRYQLAPWYIKRAEDYLQENYSDPVTMDMLAEITGVSSRSLQYGFKKARGITPMQYLKELRLERVRERLLRGASGGSVTPVAMACGFRQLGWFASQYRDKYGETPSETLKRTRSDLDG